MKVYLMIENSAGDILVNKENFTLPSIDLPKFHYAYCECLVKAVKKDLQMDVFVRHCFSYNDREAVYLARVLSPIDKEYVYLNIEKVKDNPISERELAKDVPKWADYDWYEDLTVYLNLNFEDYSITQIKVSSLSSVMKIAAGETYYFKVIPEFFQNELTIIKHLSTRYPQNVQSLYNYDLKNSCFITKDIGLPLLAECQDKEIWMRVLKDYAKMQIGEMDQVKGLLAKGITDRRMPKLIEHIDFISQRIKNVVRDEECSLTTNEIALWFSLERELKNECVKLDNTIPDTIEHGDLYLANIAFGKERVIFFDFTDICVTHPFLSLATFFAECDFKDEEIREIELAYLSCFSDYLAIDELKRVLVRAKAVGEIHLAYTYLSLYENLPKEQRWEVSKSFPSCIRHVLKKFNRRS